MRASRDNHNFYLTTDNGTTLFSSVYENPDADEQIAELLAVIAEAKREERERCLRIIEDERSRYRQFYGMCDATVALDDVRRAIGHGDDP